MKVFMKSALLVLLFAVSFVIAGCEVTTKQEEDPFPVGDDSAVYISDDYNEEWNHPVITISIKIVGGGDTVLYSGTVEVRSANPVALEALKGAIEEKGLSLTETGGFIVEIDGYTNDSSTDTYWMFKLNGASAHLGSGTLQIRDGDYLEFNYELVEW